MQMLQKHSQPTKSKVCCTFSSVYRQHFSITATEVKQLTIWKLQLSIPHVTMQSHCTLPYKHLCEEQKMKSAHLINWRIELFFFSQHEIMSYISIQMLI